MRSLRPLLAALLVVAGVLAVALVARHVRRAPRPAAQASAATPAPTPAASTLVLFFPGDDGLLHRESREVYDLPAVTYRRARLVVEELVGGSRNGWASAFPWPAAVEDVFATESGTVYVNLSAPPDNAVQGTSSEVALVYGTVNSIAANCPGVARVQLLFGGHQLETLGHLDLSRPLAPRTEFVAP
jgi:hypothetical protein